MPEGWMEANDEMIDASCAFILIHHLAKFKFSYHNEVQLLSVETPPPCVSINWVTGGIWPAYKFVDSLWACKMEIPLLVFAMEN